MLGRQTATWSGVYPRLRDVPARGPGFSGEIWVEGTRRETEAALRRLRAGTVATGPLGERGLLPLVAAAAVRNDRPMRILDFGGGMGIGYVDLRGALPLDVEIDYLVVETERVCEVGRALYVADEPVTFHTALPASPEPIDIIHVRSALQYVDEYEAVLAQLLRYGPRYALFVELSAGDIPTHATAQLNVPGSIIPYWFHDVREILGIAMDEGYAPLLRLRAELPIVGQDVPPDHRLDRACHLLLAPTTAS